jgi:putative ABC transport system permease protein
VLAEAVILAALGFIPGYGCSLLVYAQAREATNLPVLMTPDRGALVLALTVAMCAVSALLAMRKLRSADPAEVF